MGAANNGAASGDGITVRGDDKDNGWCRRSLTNVSAQPGSDDQIVESFR